MSIYRGRSTKEFYLASALYDSIEDQNTSAVVSLLTDKGADANIVLPTKGISPFHLVIGSDDELFAWEVTNLILRSGGDPNVRSDEGLTPLHIAAAWGRLDLTRLLLNCGVDPDHKDNSYLTAVDYAVDEGHHDLARLIREYVNRDVSAFFMRLDEQENCVLILDKILVNNGQAVGEYEVIKTEPDSIDLKILPQANPKEYVRNWCNTLESQLDKLNLTEDLSPKTDSINFMETSKGHVYLNNITMSRPKVTQTSDFYLSDSPKSPEADVPYYEHPLKDFCKYSEKSRESGVITLDELNIEDFNETPSRKISVNQKDCSSDYFTCTDVSENVVLEQNIFEVSSSVGSNKSSELNNAQLMNTLDVEQSFVSVSEVYRYTDPNEGVILFEKRVLPPQNCNDNETENYTVSSATSKLSSLPRSFDYDTDSLRKELTQVGFEPGPITTTTKRVYLRKLYNLKRNPSLYQCEVTPTNQKVYSTEIQKTLRNAEWTSDLTPYRILEEQVSKQFGNPDPSRKWREGVTKSSFTYLLLDPRITSKLPCRADTLSQDEVWKIFISSVFYVGKGKRSRPYQHLYEATSLHSQGVTKSKSSKLQRILDIWSENKGVVCLHIFQNVIPVEAYTREAAMISALKLENLENAKNGDFYGLAATWSPQQKRMLGVYLLYKAMKIFMHEGERQLSPNDID